MTRQEEPWRKSGGKKTYVEKSNFVHWWKEEKIGGKGGKRGKGKGLLKKGGSKKAVKKKKLRLQKCP